MSFRKFENFSLAKFKTSLNLSYFTLNFAYAALIFNAFEQKPQIVGNFLRKIWNFLLRKKSINLAYFTQNFTYAALIFNAFAQKTQVVGNFLRKL